MASLTASIEPRLAARRLRPALVLMAAVAVALASHGAVALRATPPPAANTVADSDAGAAAQLTNPDGPAIAADQLDRIDAAIGTWTANLARERRDFYAATTLGLLYETRARLTGDVADYERSMTALDRALAVAPGAIAARVLHARVQASLHAFGAALTEATAILADDPSQLQALATKGDAALELGDVTTARSAYEALDRQAPGPAVDARLSRLAFIEGRADDARRLAATAFESAKAVGESGPGLSWYASVLGGLATSAGEPDEALDWFRRATDLWPGSWIARAGTARAEVALGRTDDAIRDYAAAIAIAPQPDSLAALGDLYALRGAADLAEQQYATVDAIARLAAVSAQVFNRQLVVFAVNHDRDVALALRQAEEELAVRKDVYGYDAYAWALLANGRAVDAEAAIREALAFGTRDPLLDYHAGVIAATLGDNDRARDLLTAALAPSGALDPLAAARARDTLEVLR